MSQDPQGPQGPQATKPASKDPLDYRRWVAALVPALVGLLLFWVLFAKMSGSIVLDGKDDWGELGKVGAIALIAFGSALLLRLVMAPLVREGLPTSQGANDPNGPMRNRIAHAVLIVGGASIAILTLSLVIALAVLATKEGNQVGPKIDTLLMGLFGAVLPILATWVGTVIAFYFTNESYRQAAEATREASAGLRTGPSVTERMIPFEKIAKVEVEQRGKAQDWPMSEIVPLMKEPVTRVIVFEKETRNPIFIIRKKLVPAAWLDPAWLDPANPPKETIKDYRDLSNGANANDSIQFGFVPISATLEHAHQVLREINGADVFVTATGQKTEAVLGWLTDDLLKSS